MLPDGSIECLVMGMILCVTHQGFAFSFSVSIGVSELVSVQDQVKGCTTARVTVLRNAYPEDPFDPVKLSNYHRILPHRWRNNLINAAEYI